jgi:hypothetical protein
MRKAHCEQEEKSGPVSAKEAPVCAEDEIGANYDLPCFLIALTSGMPIVSQPVSYAQIAECVFVFRIVLICVTRGAFALTSQPGRGIGQLSPAVMVN